MHRHSLYHSRPVIPPNQKPITPFPAIPPDETPPSYSSRMLLRSTNLAVHHQGTACTVKLSHQWYSFSHGQRACVAMCGSYFYRQHILRVQFFGVIKWPVLCVPGIPLAAFWANAVKKAHKTSKLFSLRGFQVSLSELFHIAFCYFPFRFLPSPYKTPQNQKNTETTKHTKIPKKYETLILGS